jgi:hypothetical protein
MRGGTRGSERSFAARAIPAIASRSMSSSAWRIRSKATPGCSSWSRNRAYPCHGRSPRSGAQRRRHDRRARQRALRVRRRSRAQIPECLGGRSCSRASEPHRAAQSLTATPSPCRLGALPRTTRSEARYEPPRESRDARSPRSERRSRSRGRVTNSSATSLRAR